MNPTLVGVLGIAFFLMVTFLGAPIGVAMMLAGILGYWYLDGFAPMLATLQTAPYRLATTYAFTCLPAFILMGELAFRTALSSEGYNMALKWVGHLRGGLAVATIGACALFAMVTGNGIATAIIMTQVSLPEMKEAGYDDRLSIGTIGSGALLGPMIPPSGALIIYAFLTAENLGYLFIGGILPGIMLAVIYIMTIAIWVRINPSIATKGPRSTWKERVFGFPSIWAIILVFACCIGGLYTGIFTPTEAGAIGVLAIVVVSLLRGKLKWNNFASSLLSTGRTTGALLFLMMGVYIFNAFLSITQIPNGIAEFIDGLQIAPFGIMAVIMLIYFIFGFFFEVNALLFITVPIFYPIIIMLGMDGIWFGILTVLITGIGTLTPPFGVCVFAMHGVRKDIPIWTMFRGVLPFVGANLVAMIILMAFPQIVYWLPYTMTPK